MSTLKTTNIQNASAASPAIVLAADGSATAQVSSLNGGPLAGARNRIINGDMRIAQRGSASFSSVTGLFGGCDRWRLELTGFGSASGTVQQAGSLAQTGSSKSSGFVNEAFLTTTGSGTIQFTQRIEAQNCNDLNGKSITVTFSLLQDTGSAVTPYVQIIKPAALDNWSTPTVVFSQALASLPSGTLTKYTYSVTLGSSDASNGLAVALGFTIGAVTNKYFQITDVQLEPGTVATPFERRSYGQELALCQRYYEEVDGQFKFDGNLGGATISVGHTWFCQVSKRSTPTVSVLTESGGNVNNISSVTPKSNNAAFCIWEYTNGTAIGARAKAAVIRFVAEL
jgi:hypothetical protein